MLYEYPLDSVLGGTGEVWRGGCLNAACAASFSKSKFMYVCVGEGGERVCAERDRAVTVSLLDIVFEP